MATVITIEHLPQSNTSPTELESYGLLNQEALIEEVAEIEALIQPLDAWDKATIITLLQAPINQLMIAKVAQKIVGYCLYQQIFEQAEIFRIGTHPEFQRQGIANQLLNALKLRLTTASVASIMLEVRADNEPAIRLYEHQGFKRIHIRSGYYQTPNQPAVDALIMQCVL